MNHKILLLLLSLIAYCATSNPTMAQTCRINSGCVNGTHCYIDVYEYDYVDRKPQFPGGDSKLIKFINQNRRYPAEAYRRGVEGRVMCSFVVNTDGSISNVAVLKGVEASLNKEAVRIMQKMPAWSPGKINGQCVPVRVVWCVPFRK